MLTHIGRIALPAWTPFVAAGSVVAVMMLLVATIPPPSVPDINVAFIGNSMIYYNDFPRFMEALSNDRISQNSCLHGNANLDSILVWGNGMYDIWRTGSARIRVGDDSGTVHDYGACTVPQLLFGYDDALEDKVSNYDLAADDDSEGMNINYFDKSITDDYYSYFDGSNPCVRNAYYLPYLDGLYERGGEVPPQYDYIILNDNTRSPARNDTRENILQVLEEIYVPWFLETGAVPVFISTYGYNSPYRDMGGLDDIPTFTSLTYEGYRQYSQLLESYLPERQQPRIASVGTAFLLVWEENYSLWERLFHVDKVHASPLGTYLQGCVVYYTLYGRMPDRDAALRQDLSSLWNRARRFQPGYHRRSPFPTHEEASYLYNIALRVVKYGHVPESFVFYSNGEASDYIPMDDLYKIDDLF